MQEISKHIVPASALGYAITFLLLVGLFTTGVLFLTSAHKRIEAHFIGQEYLMFDNQLAILHGAEISEPGTYQLYHPSGDTSRIQLKPWGMLNSTVVKTFNKGKTIHREALTMQQTDAAFPCLYMPDSKRKIALAGETRLEGKVYASERSLMRANIRNKPLKSEKLVYGKLYKSERHLPPLNKTVRDFAVRDLLKGSATIETLPEDSAFSFGNKTTVFKSARPIEVSSRLKGNIVIQSFDQIFIRSNAKLEYVILLAPKVVFEKGFKGKVQVIASEQILCEEEVQLDYPSSLMLYEEKPGGDQSKIVLMKNARVLGGVLLVSKALDFRNPILLEAMEATIGGLVYNQGDTEIRGEIIGSLYTNKLIAHVSGGVFGGHLIDAVISTKQLPESFVMPNWLQGAEKVKPIVVACM